MPILDETFAVAPEFFDETLDFIVENIRPILLLPDEFKLVRVPFYKSESYEDKETGRWYESYKEVFYNTRKQFDIVLENSGIGHILIHYRRPDLVHVIITRSRKIREKSPSEKIERQAEANILDRLVYELCQIEPGHSCENEERQISKESDQDIVAYETAKKYNIQVPTLERWRDVYPLIGRLTIKKIAERRKVTEETIKRDCRMIRESRYMGE